MRVGGFTNKRIDGVVKYIRTDGSRPMTSREVVRVFLADRHELKEEVSVAASKK